MPETMFFDYGEKEITFLKKRDPILGSAIDKIGHIYRAVNPDMFTSLLHAVVGQQISTKAQETIWARMEEQFSPITAEKIANTSEEHLQSCGISFRKALYIKEIARTVSGGFLNLETLSTVPDEEVVQQLSQLKGIGVWTAEMLMTFSMQRPDIISYGDLAILRGMRMLYRHRNISEKLFLKYRRRYSPYATVASLYLWAIAGGACPELTDPAPTIKKKK